MYIKDKDLKIGNWYYDCCNSVIKILDILTDYFIVLNYSIKTDYFIITTYFFDNNNVFISTNINEWIDFDIKKLSGAHIK